MSERDEIWPAPQSHAESAEAWPNSKYWEPAVQMDARAHRRERMLTKLLRVTHHRGLLQRDNSSAAILYVVMGSARAAERSLLQHRTWCQHALCAFVTDDASNSSGAYDAGMRLIQLAPTMSRTAAWCCANASAEQDRSFFCSEHRSRTLAAQYRFMPALQWAKQQLLRGGSARGIDWVALVDDDSFVFPSSLNRLVGKYNASRPVHLGDFWRSDDGNPLYACGGGGSVFSRGALQRMDLAHSIRTLHRQCMQSDWMLGQCARQAGVRLHAEHGCTCVRWTAHTEPLVRARLLRGSCAFLQFPNKPGHLGGPFKDLLPLLRNATRPPAIVHQLERLV